MESPVVANYRCGIRQQDHQGRLRITAETDKASGTTLARSRWGNTEANMAIALGYCGHRTIPIRLPLLLSRCSGRHPRLRYHIAHIFSSDPTLFERCSSTRIPQLDGYAGREQVGPYGRTTGRHKLTTCDAYKHELGLHVSHQHRSRSTSIIDIHRIGDRHT